MYRKAKIYKYPVNNVQQFLRKLTLDERTGEILEDEVSNLEIVPTELSAIITNGEGRLLFSKASPKVHPMMPGGLGTTIEDLLIHLKTSFPDQRFNKDDFEEFYFVGFRKYFLCKVRQLKCSTPHVWKPLWAPGDVQDIDRLYLDAFSSRLEERLSTIFPLTAEFISPIVYVEDNFNEFSHHSFFDTEPTVEYPAMLTEGARVEIRAPQFTVAASSFTDDDLKAQLLTKSGLTKLHRQLWHIQANQLFERIKTVIDPDHHTQVRKLLDQIIKECPVCRKFQRPQTHPTGKSGGLWARYPGQIVAADTFYFKFGNAKVAIIHCVDLFSGYSVLYLCPKPDPTAEDSISALLKWSELFGDLPTVVFTDQGGEFRNQKMTSFLSQHTVTHLFSPPQSPYSNGVNEKHNGLVKVFLGKLYESCPQAPLLDLLAEAVIIKNLTTRRAGYSAKFLVFGYDSTDRFTTTVQDMATPSPVLSSTMRHRLELRQAAWKAVYDLRTRKQLCDSLSRVVQSTDKTPFTPGQRVDYWVIPDQIKRNAYWEPNCTVIGIGGTGTTHKLWIIKRANGEVQEVARNRLRLHYIPNLLQFSALDPTCLPDSVQSHLRRSESTTPDPVSSDPDLLDDVDSHEAQLGQEMLHDFVDFFMSSSHSRGQARDLVRQHRDLARLRRRKKKILEDDDEPAAARPSSAPKSLPARTSSTKSSSKKSLPPEQRRSARINPGTSGGELREIVDHRLSRLRTAPQKASQKESDPSSEQRQEAGSPEPDRFYDWLGGDAPTPNKLEERPETPPAASQPTRSFAPNYGPARAPPPSRPSAKDPSDVSQDKAPEKFSLDEDSEDPTDQDESKDSAEREMVEDDKDVVTDPNVLLPEGCFITENPTGEKSILLWTENKDCLLSTDECKKWVQTYSHLYQYLTEQAKVKIKAGREVPRVDALQDPRFWKGMEKEIDQLIANGAKFLPPPSADIFVYSSRWVFTYKEDGTRKARLVVRGFEEHFNPDASESSTDSPTLNRESLRLIALKAARNRWLLSSWDIRTAFQQAQTSDDPDCTKSERDGLWIKPPKYFPGKYHLGPADLIKIASNRTLYGMASAPRRFYFTLRKTLMKYGLRPSKSDDCLFLLHDQSGELIGVSGWHVDDGLLCGTKEFYDVMEKVAKDLEFGKRQERDFKFCGIRIQQDSDYTVHMDQTHMVDDLEVIPITPGRPDSDKCSPAEITQLRGRIGSILYIVGLTRPFESYAVSHIAGFVLLSNVEHLRAINKVITFMKSTRDYKLTYPGGIKTDYLYTFHDSNFRKERDSGSQLGLLSYLGGPIDSKGRVTPAVLVRWTSRRARRVCHSTLAAETLAATAGLDLQSGLVFRLKELDIHPESVLITDCRSLHDHVYSMTSKSAEILLPDVHELREAAMPWRSWAEDHDQQCVELWWCPTDRQLADNLTKLATPSTLQFMESIRTNSFSLGETYVRPRPSQRSLKSLATLRVDHFFAWLTAEQNPEAAIATGDEWDLPAWTPPEWIGALTGSLNP